MLYRLLVIFIYIFNLDDAFILYHSIYRLKKCHNYYKEIIEIDFNDGEVPWFENLYNSTKNTTQNSTRLNIHT